MTALAERVADMSKTFLASGDSSAETYLRAIRRETAGIWLGAAEDDLPALYAGQLGRVHRLMMQSNMASFPLDADERAFVDAILHQADCEGKASAAVRQILAGMLYVAAHEIPVKYDLGSVPQWFAQDYLDYVIAEPLLFRRTGESRMYIRHMENILAEALEFMTRPDDGGNLKALSEFFTLKLKLIHAYFNEHDLRDLYRSRAEIAELFLASRDLLREYTFSRCRRGRKKIRLGVISAGNYMHTETFFRFSMLGGLDRGAFEIFHYTFANGDETMERHAREMADKFISLANLDLPTKCGRIRRDDLDLALITTNITAVTNEMFLLSLSKLARVQVSTMVSPVTCGIAAMDCFLSSEFNEPPQDAQEHYTEKLLMTGGSLNQYAFDYDKAPASINVDRAALGIEPGKIVFFSGANFYKILPELSRAWAKILAAVPDSVLILMPFNPNWSSQYPRQALQCRLREDLQAESVEAQRLIMIDPLPNRADVHQVISLADVYLDSYPFGGACSLFDPMSVGCPAVVREGPMARGRHGSAILRMYGLEEWIAASEEQYVQKAVRLAQDGDARQAVHRTIVQVNEKQNPVLDRQSLGRRMTPVLKDAFEDYRRQEDRLYNRPADQLRAEVQAVAAGLDRNNARFAKLTDEHFVPLLFLPYFNSLSDAPGPMHMVDVGACYGAMALPFLRGGWTADLFEADPDCQAVLGRNVSGFARDTRIHNLAAGPENLDSITFHKAGSNGLSGLSPSPYGKTERQISVRCVRLGDYLREIRTARVDFLKIDTEGWDIDILKAHDFDALPPRLAMIETNTIFPRQTIRDIDECLAWMDQRGYGWVIMEYEDDGNFAKGIWRYKLDRLRIDERLDHAREKFMANIIFYRKDDSALLATLLRAIRPFAKTTSDAEKNKAGKDSAEEDNPRCAA